MPHEIQITLNGSYGEAAAFLYMLQPWMGKAVAVGGGGVISARFGGEKPPVQVADNLIDLMNLEIYANCRLKQLRREDFLAARKERDRELAGLRSRRTITPIRRSRVRTKRGGRKS